VRGGEGGELLERRRSAVVVRLDLREHGGVRAPRADGGQVLPDVIHRVLHLVLGVLLDVGDHAVSPSFLVGSSRVTSVPISSPRTTRAMLPGTERLKKTMLRLLSRASAMAVASATFRSSERNWS